MVVIRLMRCTVDFFSMETQGRVRRDSSELRDDGYAWRRRPFRLPISVCDSSKNRYGHNHLFLSLHKQFFQLPDFRQFIPDACNEHLCYLCPLRGRYTGHCAPPFSCSCRYPWPVLKDPVIHGGLSRKRRWAGKILDKIGGNNFSF